TDQRIFDSELSSRRRASAPPLPEPSWDPRPFDRTQSGGNPMTTVRRAVLLCGLLLLPLLGAPPADACPVCKRDTGRRVRAGLFDEDLGPNLLATVLPFGVFLGIAAGLRFGLPGPRRDPPAAGPDPS